MTSWEHPKMLEQQKALAHLNEIRFSAYRTAMKLRTLQKRLWLDLVALEDAVAAFDALGLRGAASERHLDTTQLVQCLNKLFQPAVRLQPGGLDLVLAVDLTLNWLLSVYDPARCGQITVLALKVAFGLKYRCSPRSSRQFQSRPKISDCVREFDATIQKIKKKEANCLICGLQY